MNIKKMFRKSGALTLSVVLMLSMFSAFTVSAATTASVAYTEGEPATITVTITTDKPERAAVVSVYSVYAEEKYWILAETTRTAQNRFTYTNTLPLAMPSGVYTVCVNVGGEEASDTFTHFNIAGANSAIDRINAATAATFAGELRDPDVYINLAIDVEEFNAYADLITELYFKLKPLNPDSTPKVLSISEFSTLYSKCVALAKLKGATTDTIVTYLADNSSAIGFDYAAFEALADAENPEVLTDEQKEIIGRFSAGIYTETDTDTQYQHWFCVASINAKVIDTTNVYKTALFETYDAILNLDTTDYNKVADENAVIKAVMENKYDSVQAIRNAFYAAVANAPIVEEEIEEEEDSPSGGYTGGRTPGISIGLMGGKTDKDTNKETEEKVEQTKTFSDVAPNHWCAEPIKTLYGLSVVSGDGDGNFRPNAAVSRAEFTKMLMNALFSGRTATSSAGFVDVAESQWYVGYVNLAAELGIILGDESGNFRPNATITRQDMAVMVKRAVSKAGVAISDGEKAFADNNLISEYAKEAVSALASTGILNGMDNGNFEPQGELLRAQAVKALFEIMKIGGRI